MNHDWQPVPASQVQVALERLDLLVKRRPVPISVQTRFTDGGNAWRDCQPFNHLKVVCVSLGHMIGLDPHGGMNELRLGRKPYAFFAIRRRRSNRQYLPDTGAPRS
jgi:hypothetical protein